MEQDAQRWCLCKNSKSKDVGRHRSGSKWKKQKNQFHAWEKCGIYRRLAEESGKGIPCRRTERWTEKQSWIWNAAEQRLIKWFGATSVQLLCRKAWFGAMVLAGAEKDNAEHFDTAFGVKCRQKFWLCMRHHEQATLKVQPSWKAVFGMIDIWTLRQMVPNSLEFPSIIQFATVSSNCIHLILRTESRKKQNNCCACGNRPDLLILSNV